MTAFLLPPIFSKDPHPFSRASLSSSCRPRLRCLSPPKCAITSVPESLAPFSENILGEWTGYEARLSPTGTYVPLPDYYIPQDFVDWNLIPKGFEITHSIILRDTTLYLKRFRILPTVTIFGDHVDLEEDLFKYDMLQSGNVAFSDGCFTTGTSQVVAKKSSKLDKDAKVRFCLRARDSAGVKQGVQVEVVFDFEQACAVGEIALVVEKWTCIYCDGADIEGSSGFVEGWLGEPASAQEDVLGVWERDGHRVERGTGDLGVLLPRGIEIGVERVDEGVQVWVGWMAEKGKRLLVSRTYDKEGVFVGANRFEERRV